MKALVPILVVALFAGCEAGMAGNDEAPPTGAKEVADEFGRYVHVDEECGGTDLPEYPDHFQNALFRDGAVGRGRLWLVDGSHLWSAPVPVTNDIAVSPRLEVPLIGIANAVVATDKYLAVATLDQGLRMFPDYDFDRGQRLGGATQTLDADASRDGYLLAVAAGGQGVAVFDVSFPESPLVAARFDIDGWASGVRWGAANDQTLLYYAACAWGGYVDMANRQPAVQALRFEHPNVKDAHGDGAHFVVANNGGGVWAAQMPGFDGMMRYIDEDPLYYANAVFVSGSYAFVAAGNRELQALRLADLQPETAMQRDPISILVRDRVVYGFGNFREVGERTVVRAPRITEGSEADAFAAGLATWVEPQPHALRFEDDSGEWLVKRMADGYAVFHAGPTDAVWARRSEYRFFAYAGTYAVSVTADDRVRFFAAGSTTPIESASWPRWLASDAHAEVFDDGVVVYYAGDSKKYVYPIGNDFVAPEPAQPLVQLCDFASIDGRTNADRRFLFGTNRDGVTVRWCSRLVDPFLAAYRAEDDMGTTVRFYQGGVTAEALLPASGVAQVIAPSTERLFTLIDDRIAYTTSLVEWDLSQRDAPRERSRYVLLGRGVGWAPLSTTAVRVWMADGAMFTYDFDRRTREDIIAPPEEGAP